VLTTPAAPHAASPKAWPVHVRSSHRSHELVDRGRRCSTAFGFPASGSISGTSEHGPERELTAGCSPAIPAGLGAPAWLYSKASSVGWGDGVHSLVDRRLCAPPDPRLDGWRTPARIPSMITSCNLHQGGGSRGDARPACRPDKNRAGGSRRCDKNGRAKKVPLLMCFDATSAVHSGPATVTSGAARHDPDRDLARRHDHTAKYEETA